MVHEEKVPATLFGFALLIGGVGLAIWWFGGAGRGGARGDGAVSAGDALRAAAFAPPTAAEIAQSESVRQDQADAATLNIDTDNPITDRANATTDVMRDVFDAGAKVVYDVRGGALVIGALGTDDPQSTRSDRGAVWMLKATDGTVFGAGFTLTWTEAVAQLARHKRGD